MESETWVFSLNHIQICLNYMFENSILFDSVSKKPIFKV